MNLTNLELINLPVLTEGGTALGKISGFEVEADTGKILFFYVKSGLLKELLNKSLMISFSQVISLDKEKMVVQDSVRKIPALDLERAQV